MQYTSGVCPACVQNVSGPFDNAESPPTLTVSQLNRRVRTLLESQFDFI